jgi:hypothetical protein
VAVWGLGRGGSVLDMDPKLLAGSGSGKNHFESLRIRNKFEEKNYFDKVIKFTVSHKKCTIAKKSYFFQKRNYP